MCPQLRTHWRHLANTVEPSICCDNAALCQITLTTCYVLEQVENIKEQTHNPGLRGK